MNDNQIIKSILDNDLYKFTMGNAVFKLFPRLMVSYKFTDRNNLSYPDGFDEKIKDQLNLMRGLSLTHSEKSFLTEKCGEYLPPTYIDFLEGFRYDPTEVDVELDGDNKLNISIEGYWYRTILWEVVLMALVSELYFIETNQKVDLDQFSQVNIDKVKLFEKHNAYFADMGTRRRYSFDNHLRVLRDFKENSNHTFVGSSNVYMGYKLDIPILGTIAHEFTMVMSALYGYKMANHMAMENWLDVYGEGLLGTILPDAFTTDVFLKSFNYKFASLFSGIRHDSGDPFEFVDKIVNHYKKLGIDPMIKTIIFSDGLSPEKACQIKEYCVDKIKSSFGLGTNFTNNLDNIKPLSIVIKVDQVLVNGTWENCVKISDDLGKNTGNIDEIKLCKQILRIN